MTLESRVNQNKYVGNGATKQFPFTFKVWKTDQVLVYIGNGDTEKEVSSQCTINITASGGTVVFPYAPEEGKKIILRRIMPYIQDDDYRNGTRFDSEEIESRLDQDCAERQDLRLDVDRAVKVPLTSNKTSERWFKDLLAPIEDINAWKEMIINWLEYIGTDVVGTYTPVVAQGSNTPRALGQRFAEIVNVKDYGAKGDGVADDTTSFESAAQASVNAFQINTPPSLDAIKPVTRGVVFVPSGEYNISSHIETNNADIVWFLSDNAIISNISYLPGTLRRSSRISRRIPYGIMDYACAFSVAQGGHLTRESDRSAGVMGINNPSGLATYPDRDAVSLFVNAAPPPLVADISSATYTSTSIVPATPLTAEQVSMLRVGMIIDTKHETRCSGIVDSWASDGTVINIKTGWYAYGTPSSTVTPANGVGAYVNAFTKIWSQNTALHLENESNAPYCNKAIVHEYSIYNERGDASFDITNLDNSIRGVVVVSAGGPGYYRGQTAFYASGLWRYGMYINAGAGIDVGIMYNDWKQPTEDKPCNAFVSKTLGNHFVGIEQNSQKKCFVVDKLGNIKIGAVTTSLADRIRTITFNTAQNESESSVEIQAIGGSSYGTGELRLNSTNIGCGGNVYPRTSSTFNLGDNEHLWQQVWASVGTIQTSDERYKDKITDIPDDVLDAWEDVSWKQFKFLDAVEQKGEDARLHSGIIAQAVKATFEAHNLDATKYGLLCWDEWSDKYEEIEVEDAPAEFDDDGKLIKHSVTHVERIFISPAGNRWSVRYDEALAMEAAYQRRRADRLEARLAALEERVNQLTNNQNA